jgi:hypothetical protein
LGGITNKLKSSIKATLNDLTYHVKVGIMMTVGFKIGHGLKKGDGLPPDLFNTALECVIIQLSAEVKSTIFHKSVQLIA